MSVVRKDKLEGELILKEQPQGLSWTTPLEFLKVITKYVTPEFPVRGDNDFIVSGRNTPSPDNNDKMWAREDNNRNWLGWHKFIRGKWRRAYEYRSDQVIWMVGNSTNIPEGFQLIDASTPGFSGNVLNQITGQYVETSPGSGVYEYFAVRFIGY